MVCAAEYPCGVVGKMCQCVLTLSGVPAYAAIQPRRGGILIWGGLKGGLALAMAMSIPAGIVLTPELELRDLLLVMTYAVVVFSIMVQGSTVSRLIRRSREAAEAGKAAAESTQAV